MGGIPKYSRTSNVRTTHCGRRREPFPMIRSISHQDCCNTNTLPLVCIHRHVHGLHSSISRRLQNRHTSDGQDCPSSGHGCFSNDLGTSLRRCEYFLSEVGIFFSYGYHRFLRAISAFGRISRFLTALLVRNTSFQLVHRTYAPAIFISSIHLHRDHPVKYQTGIPNSLLDHTARSCTLNSPHPRPAAAQPL